LELRSYGLKYESRTSIKGHILVDFISGTTEYTYQLEGWTLNVDGASNSKGAGIDIILITPEGSIIE